MGRTIDSVRTALERELQSDRGRSRAERARATQRLQRELKGLRGAAPLRSPAGAGRRHGRHHRGRAPSPTRAGNSTTAPPPERRGDEQLPPERRGDDTPPAERREDAGNSPPRRSENVPPTPRRDGTGITPVRATGTEPEQLPAFPDALQPVRPEDALFQDRQPPAGPVAEPDGGGRRGTCRRCDPAATQAGDPHRRQRRAGEPAAAAGRGRHLPPAGDLDSDRHPDHRPRCLDRLAVQARPVPGAGPAAEDGDPAQPLPGRRARMLRPARRLRRSRLRKARLHARRDRLLRAEGRQGHRDQAAGLCRRRGRQGRGARPAGHQAGPVHRPGLDGGLPARGGRGFEQGRHRHARLQPDQQPGRGQSLGQCGAQGHRQCARPDRRVLHRPGLQPVPGDRDRCRPPTRHRAHRPCRPAAPPTAETAHAPCPALPAFAVRPGRLRGGARHLHLQLWPARKGSPAPVPGTSTS